MEAIAGIAVVGLLATIARFLSRAWQEGRWLHAFHPKEQTNV